MTSGSDGSPSLPERGGQPGDDVKGQAGETPFAPPRRSLLGRPLLIVPVLAFAVIALLFLAALLSGRDASTIPSALIGQPAPQTVLAPLPGSALPGLDTGQFGDGPVLVNVFASWCAPCRVEHPLLMDLAAVEGLTIAGLNYKDQPTNAERFLASLGNPYDMIGSDPNGRAAIDWGVYGVPETFLVDGDGTIVWKHVGPLSEEVLRDGLMPFLEGAAPLS